MTELAVLPTMITVLERGWVSSNNIVFDDGDCASVVDTGYAIHAQQTVQLVRAALAGTDLGEHVLGGMAELLQARQDEEAAIALHGVDETEDLVEPLAIAGIAFPGDDRTGQRLEHVARFREEVVDQCVHGPVR